MNFWLFSLFIVVVTYTCINIIAYFSLVFFIVEKMMVTAIVLGHLCKVRLFFSLNARFILCK